MRDKPDQELPLREVLLGDARTPSDAQEEAKQKVKELAELWLDEHPWARRAADSYRKEVEARTAAERCKKTSKVGRFSSLLASGGALPTDLQLAPGYGRCAPSFTEQSAESSSPSRLRRLQKAAKTAPVIQESLRAKMMALIVASVESEADVDLLKQCLESICAQTTAPRALWVCWYADSKLRFLVRELLEEIMPRCIRKGTPLTQLQMEEPVGQWRHVEAVLRARQKMGGDVCDMWVALAQAHEVWQPERCRRFCEEASQASNCVPALLWAGRDVYPRGAMVQQQRLDAIASALQVLGLPSPSHAGAPSLRLGLLQLCLERARSPQPAKFDASLSGSATPSSSSAHRSGGLGGVADGGAVDGRKTGSLWDEKICWSLGGSDFRQGLSTLLHLCTSGSRGLAAHAAVWKQSDLCRRRSVEENQ